VAGEHFPDVTRFPVPAGCMTARARAADNAYAGQFADDLTAFGNFPVA